MSKAGAGRFLTAIILALFAFANIASAKSRVTHKSNKEQSSRRQSRVAHKAGKEHLSARQSRLARKISKEPAGRKSRMAYKSSKEKAGRQSRVARRTNKEQSVGRQSRFAQRTGTMQPPAAQASVAQRINREQTASQINNNQIVQPLPLEPKISSASQDTIPTKKPVESQTNLEMENAVIPPAPIIVKRSANTILIPMEVAAGGSKAKPDPKSDLKADSKPDSKTESKYEERPAVLSSVSVGSAFGYRRDPFTRRAKFHSGVDLKARWGDPVGASQAGTVQFAGWYHGYGNMIIVAHGGGVTTQYAHLSSFDVEPGTHVDRGTIIGRAGSTGRATSPHLHYEVRFEGTAISPFQPLALDSSSDYFKQSRPVVDSGHSESTAPVSPQQEK